MYIPQWGFLVQDYQISESLYPITHVCVCVCVCVKGGGPTDVDFNEDIIPCVVAAHIHDLEDLI